MKKFLSLVLGITLVLSMATFATAAVTVGGELRTWYQMSQSNNNYLNTFNLDRINLTIDADLSETGGFKDEFQFNGVKKDSSFCVDYGYYYQKDVLLKGDELDFGVLGYANALPFKNGYGNGKWVAGLGDGLKVGPTAGARYWIRKSSYDLGVGVGNANTLYSSTTSTTTTSTITDGLDYSLRTDYLPIKGLKVGMGYEHVATAANPSETYNNILIVDSSFNPAPWGYLVEYVNFDPTISGVNGDTLNAYYVEGVYKVGAFQPYLARAVNINGTSTNNVIALMKKSSPTTGSTALSNVGNNYTMLGCDYSLNPHITLTGEYVRVDDYDGNTDQWSLGFRLRATF
jgi:hypothetical protein